MAYHVNDSNINPLESFDYLIYAVNLYLDCKYSKSHVKQFILSNASSTAPDLFRRVEKTQEVWLASRENVKRLSCRRESRGRR